MGLNYSTYLFTQPNYIKIPSKDNLLRTLFNLTPIHFFKTLNIPEIIKQNDQTQFKTYKNRVHIHYNLTFRHAPYSNLCNFNILSTFENLINNLKRKKKYLHFRNIIKTFVNLLQSSIFICPYFFHAHL